MTPEEARWLATWGTLIGAGIAIEIVALRGGKPHAPLSHHLRRAPARGWPGKALFVFAAWRFHNHLYGSKT